MSGSAILAIDQGTTGTRAILYDHRGRVLATHYREVHCRYPRSGWVEQNPEELIASVRAVVSRVVSGPPRGLKVEGIGITNQRETTVLWDRRTGRSVHAAIVWQCRRSVDICRALRKKGLDPLFRRKTGLVLDPYFSGTKLTWIFRTRKDLLKRAQRGELAFGTVDSWLLWHLTGGRSHATDMTNASRTLLFDLRARRWDRDLADHLEVPMVILPKALPSAASFGTLSKGWGVPCGAPITGIAGDQQAALFGQGGERAGQIKNTYGTGCFLVMNTGPRRVFSKGGLLTTLCCGPGGRPSFGLEGSVFVAGAAIQWLRDQLRFLKNSSESSAIAARAARAEGLVVVPAFTGLGAPYWRPDVRGAIFGITRATTPQEIVQATLESLAYQTCDVLDVMRRDSGIPIRSLRVDGGASQNDYLMQVQADLARVTIERSPRTEATAWGAARLAALGAGFGGSLFHRMQGRAVRFKPQISALERARRFDAWRGAIRKLLA